MTCWAGVTRWGPACYALKDRDRWISWSAHQRIERLTIIALALLANLALLRKALLQVMSETLEEQSLPQLRESLCSSPARSLAFLAKDMSSKRKPLVLPAKCCLPKACFVRIRGEASIELIYG